MALFGWGKLKLALVTEHLGDEDAMAARITMPPLPPPVVPEPRSAAVADPSADLASVVTPWLRSPIVEFAKALTAVPPITPREWTPANQGGSGTAATNYVELASVDVNDTMALVERLGSAIKGDV